MAKKLKLGNDLINAVKEIILNTSYPIGRIIVSIDNVNPGTYLGGTWTQVAKGRTLVGAFVAELSMRASCVQVVCYWHYGGNAWNANHNWSFRIVKMRS